MADCTAVDTIVYNANTYDTIGNITSMGGSAYSYKTGGRTKPHAVTQVGSSTYTYDNNGNMLTRPGQTITWDVENRPISITGGKSYFYNGDGNRVKEIDGNTYVYVNRYYEKNITTGEVTTHYYLGDKEVALKKGSTVSYILQDHLGSSAVYADVNGAWTGIIRYGLYGAGTYAGGSFPTDEGYTGQRLDSTGLYYYNARYYDPVIGRFISADTIVPNPANPQSLNTYSYVLNKTASSWPLNGGST